MMTERAARYQLQTRLGKGDGAETWRALDLLEQQVVIVKRLALNYLPDWKALELFERQARVLAELKHARVPRLLDYWQEAQSAWLVMQQIAGQSLEQKLATGWRPTETELKALLAQLLEILVDMHALQPPLVHRDIKPSNLMLDPEGQLYLIDFGALQASLHPAGSTTVVGTFGYMPPEQLRGQSLPASDLYSSAVMALELLNGGPVSGMLNRELMFDFRFHLQISAHFASWLARMLDPDLKRRFPSAQAALQALRALGAPAETRMDLRFLPPAGYRCWISRYPDRLEVRFKPGLPALLMAAGWGLGCLFELSVLYTMANLNHRSPWDPLIGFLFVLPLLVATLLGLGHSLLTLALRTELCLSGSQFEIHYHLFQLIHWQRSGPSAWFFELAEQPTQAGNQQLIQSVLGAFLLQPDLQTRYLLGLGVASAEQDWIMAEIQDFLYLEPVTGLPEAGRPWTENA